VRMTSSKQSVSNVEPLMGFDPLSSILSPLFELMILTNEFDPALSDLKNT